MSDDTLKVDPNSPPNLDGGAIKTPPPQKPVKEKAEVRRPKLAGS